MPLIILLILCAISLKTNLLAILSSEGEVKLYDIPTLKEKMVLPPVRDTHEYVLVFRLGTNSRTRQPRRGKHTCSI